MVFFSPLIHDSEVIVQNGCTSSLEAFISNKKVIDFNPIKNKGNKFGEFTKEFAIIAKTNKQVLDEILSKTLKHNQKTKKKLIIEWYFWINFCLPKKL